MTLTEQFILECADDKELFRALSAELCRRVPERENDMEAFVARMRTLPQGLRAMASTYQLDVSLALDDLGWHFANWHHREYCEETILGLQELEAHEAADIFLSAYALVQPYWDTIGRLLQRDWDDFVEWYPESDLEKALDPLNDRMWDLCKRTELGLLSYWVPYARKYPRNMVQSSEA